MDLTQKFKDVASGTAVRIESLDGDKRYPVLRAEWLTTKHGKTILLTIREDYSTVVKMFLPKRYGDTFSDTDIVVINNRSVQYHVIYKGRCSRSNSHILHLNDTMRSWLIRLMWQVAQ